MEAGKNLNLAGDLNVCFNTSYVELRSKSWVHVVGAGPTTVQMPYSWGSHASRLVKVLLEGHKDPTINRQVHLDSEGFDRIITWIDLNACYYPEYAAGAYRDMPFGRSPISSAKMERITALTGVELKNGNLTMISFNRPESSPCLEKLSPESSQYTEVLSLIREGKDFIAKNPRPDMPNFQLNDKIELEQQAKYDALRKAQADARAAIIAGEKRYESKNGI
jgi:hypothetical protein